MPNTMSSIQLRESSLGAHYDDVVHARFALFWKRKHLILQILGVALALGVLALFALPQRYTAVAYVYEGSAVRSSVGPADRPINFDASLLVETQARLLRSHQLARQVVQQLGFERLGAEVAEGFFSSWLQMFFYGDTIGSSTYKLDMAAAKLLKGLTVETEPRVYLISARYTAGDPRLAADITNAFVTEYLRINALQTASDQVASSQIELSRSLATLGEKHPTIVKMKLAVEAAEANFKRQMLKTPTELQTAAGETVAFAQPVTVPSSPNALLVIVSFVFAGLAIGLGVCLFLERRNMNFHASILALEPTPKQKPVRQQPRRSPANGGRATSTVTSTATSPPPAA
jgi:uncharacterized protein involved in exopolysaccharide biosynthesis